MNEVYILVYQYHDDNYTIYADKESLEWAVKRLKEDYKNDSDFKYRVFKGIEITNIIEQIIKNKSYEVVKDD